MFIRPRTEIYNMEWVSADQETEGARLIADYRVQSKLSCSVCHR